MRTTGERKMTTKLDAAGIRSGIERALKRRRRWSTGQAKDIAFHMTDWLDELSRLYAFCEAPGRLKPQEIEELLLAFLIHVPNHVAAAGKLMADLPVTDVFEVGAVDCGHKRRRGSRGRSTAS